MKLLRPIVALMLAITVVAPSVYLGALPPQEVRAQIGEVTAAAATAAAGGYAACNLGGWIQSWLSNLIPWLSPNVSAAEATVTAPLVVTASAAAAASASAAVPLAGAVTEAYLQSLAITVPTNNPSQAVADAAVVAQLGTINAAIGTIAQTSQIDAQASISSATSDGAITFKKCVLDPLMWAAKDAFIQIITNDIIDWIEGGFEGTPAFLSDPEDFFKGVADTVLQDFLYDSGLDAFLCEPFSLDIIFGISMDYNRPAYGEWGRLSCSLDEVFPGVDINIDVDGDGTTDTTVPGPGAGAGGGYDITTETGSIWGYGYGADARNGIIEPTNNIIGQTLDAQQETLRRIGAQQSEEGMKLEMGKGWFSLKCDVDGDFIKDGVCTPGEFVAGHINNYTNSALEQLTIADEFSEILNALFTALVEQLLQEVTDGGGLGLRS